MRCQPTEELAAGSSIVDAQEHVRAEVWRRPLPENGRLDFVQLERRRTRRTLPSADSSTDDMVASSMGPVHTGRTRTNDDALRY